MTQVLYSGSLLAPSNRAMCYQACSLPKTWGMPSLESKYLQLSPSLLMAIQWRGLSLNILLSNPPPWCLLMIYPTRYRFCPSSVMCSLMTNCFLRSCHLVVHWWFWRAMRRTLASQSPPKMCLCGLMKSSESWQQISFICCLVQAWMASRLLTLCMPHSRERKACRWKKFSSIWDISYKYNLGHNQLRKQQLRRNQLSQQST